MLEVMLVVMILSVALLVFIQVTSKSVVHSIESQDSIIAAGLAQEGVELVKNIRDNNWADKKTAFALPFLDNIGYDCRISYDDATTCSYLGSNYDLKLKTDSGGEFYSHSGGSVTKFFRKINIRKQGDTRIVTSYVIWSRPDFPALSDCNPAHKCVYATITLTQWGE